MSVKQPNEMLGDHQDEEMISHDKGLLTSRL